MRQEGRIQFHPGRDQTFDTQSDRLPQSYHLFRLRSRHRMARQAKGQDERRLFDIPALCTGVDHEPGVHCSEPRRTRNDRHVRLGRQVRHNDRAFLLAGRGSGHGFRGRVHDAVLLRQSRAECAGVPEAALRREDARLERDHVRDHDHLLLRHQHVRTRAAISVGLGLEFHKFGPAFRRHCAGLYVARRAHERDLQRSGPVFPDCAGLRAFVDSGGRQGGRLERYFI